MHYIVDGTYSTNYCMATVRKSDSKFRNTDTQHWIAHRGASAATVRNQHTWFVEQAIQYKLSLQIK